MTGQGTSADVWVAQPVPPRRRRGLWIALFALLALVVLAGNAFAYDLYRYAQGYDGRLLPGATIAGVDVSGMSAPEAVASVEAALAPALDREVTVRGGGLEVRASLRTLGATSDLGAVVEAALDHARGASWAALARARWQGASLPFDADVAIDEPVAAIERLVADLGDDLYIPAADAGLNWTVDWLELVPERPGRAVRTADAVADLRAALAGDADAVELRFDPVAAEHTTADFREVLFLRQHAHALDLYLDGELARTYTVAVGTSGYPTPTGVYHVTEKRHMPTWVNPAPNGWGRHLPARIGPGTNNPLGVRALNWSAPGAIRFHGTAAVDSLGRDASHGCVRLSNGDVVDLYDRVAVGAWIVSVRG